MTAPTPFDRRAIPPEAVESRWQAADGTPIRRIDWPAPDGAGRGSLLFMPGRGDCYEKYLETLAGWSDAGWRVTAADWRGQAGSGRLGHDMASGHIDDFATWVADLARLWRDWTAHTPGPHVLAGHSMGGHLVLRALAERQVDPAALVITAPMLGLLPQWLPTAGMHLAALMQCRLGDPLRPAWKMNEKPGTALVERADLLTHDAERYADEQAWRAMRPELAMGAGTWGWVERATASIMTLERPGVLESVRTPVLIVATSADRLVSHSAIVRAARRLPDCELVVFGAEARHELLREVDPVRDRVLAAIDAFLDTRAPPEG